MLKAEKLLQLRGCMLRTCNAARMPYQSRTCADTNSAPNQALRQWQFKQRLQPKQPNPCRRRRTLAPPVDYCQPRPMSEYTLAELRGGQYMPAKYRRVRVTHEQRTLLDRYEAHSRLGAGDPLVVDERQQPGLATYLRNVMENDNFYNKLYCIDFYNNYDVDGGAGGRGGGGTSPPNYMDPDELARLFELLRLGIELTPEQLAYLQQFLLQLALLDPAEMAAYLAMFAKMGLLTPNVLLLLQKLMQDLNIDPRRLQALNSVIGVALDKAMAAAAAAAAAEAEANAKRLAELGLTDVDGTGAGVLRTERVYGPDGFDASGFDRNGFDRNGFNKDGLDANGFDRFGFDRNGFDRNGLKRGEAEQQRKQLLAERAREKAQREQVIMPYQKPEVRLARKKRVPCTGQCKGYYEPWDAELSWEDAQELVERAAAWRTMRLDLEKFNYTRGLEKYVAELERSKPKKATKTK